MKFRNYKGRKENKTPGSHPQGGGNEKFPRPSGDGQINTSIVKAFTFQYHDHDIDLSDSCVNLMS